MPLLLQLFLTFLKIGAFTFGGGYAMISLIENECVERRAWITHDEMINLTVIAESTPGPIAINCATYVGYKQKGFWGALIATIGMILPSFIIIYVISKILDQFLAISWVSYAFHGIQIAVGILIVNAGLNMFSKMKKTPLSITLLIGVILIMLLSDIFAWGISTIVLMIACGVIGLTIYLLTSKKKKEEEAHK